MSWLVRWVSPRVRDSRGNPVPLAWIDGFTAFDPSVRRLPRGLFEDARREVFRKHRLGGIVASVIGGVGAGVGVLPGMMIAKRAGVGLPATFALAMASALVLAAPLLWGAVLPITRRMYAKRLRAFVLSRGHCPTCGYSLAGVTGDRADEVMCPECGAAWGRRDVRGGLPTYGRNV